MGGAGTWDNGITANWSPSSTGGGCVTWNNAATDSAFFYGPASYAVTVSGNKTANRIYRVAGGANANLTGRVTITFAGTDSGVHADTGAYITLSCNFAGTITKTGAGRLEANNCNNTAKWILKGGMTTFAAANRFNPLGGYKGSDFITFDGGGIGIAWSSTSAAKSLPSDKGITIKEGGAYFGASSSANDIWIESPILDGTGGTGNGGLTVTTGSPFSSPYAAGGMVVLSNLTATVNNYRGPTRVYGNCTIRLGSTNQIPDHSPLEVRGGTFNTGGFSETVASVLMTGGTITGAGTLTGTGGYTLQAGTCSTILGGAGVVATKTTAGTLELSAANTFTGGFNFNAGTIRVGNNAALGAANSIVNLANGVTLGANSATARTLTYLYNVNGDVNIGINDPAYSGSLTLAGWMNLGGSNRTLTVENTNTISAVITNGGLTKAGAGLLRLTGANQYTGPTTNAAGRLLTTAASAGAGSYTVNDNATLEVTAISTTNSLAMSDLTLGACTLEFDLAALGFPNTNLITIANDLNVNNLVTVNVKGFDTVGGPVTLLKYLGGRTGFGSFALGMLPPRVSASILDDTANQRVLLDIFAADSLVWVGGTSQGYWDINTTANWKLASDGTPTTYQETAVQGDTVRFDDTATGTTEVDILGPVSPFSITVDNSTLDYTFATITSPGVGKITGPGKLIKNGSGQLTVTNANDFTGGTIFNDGIINLGHNSAIGTGRLTVNNSPTLRSDGPATRTLSVPQTLNGNLIVQSDAAHGDLTFSGVIDGAGGITKVGSGVLSLTAANTFTGGVNHNAGTLRVNSNNALGATGSTVDLGNGVTLAVTSTTGRTLTYAFNLNGDLTLGQATGGTGPVTLAGSLNLGGANRVITLSNAADTISAVITNGGITLNSPGTLTLSGANNYHGDTIANAGVIALTGVSTGSGNFIINPGAVISVNSTATLGNGSGTLVLAGGRLNSTASRSVSAAPIPNPINLTADSEITTTSIAATVDLNLSGIPSGSAGTLTFRNDAASGTGIFEPRFSAGGFTFSRPIVIINNTNGTSFTRLNFFSTNDAGDQIFSGVISGNGSVRRSASTPGTGGTTILTAANTYTGGTTINGGRLLANNSSGSATGIGPVTVNSDGVLGGTGTVGGPVTVNNGGVIEAGAGGAGILTLINGLNLSSGGTNIWKLQANSLTNPGVDFDQLILTGGELVLGGSSRLLVKFTGSATYPTSSDPFWQSPRQWKIISLTQSATNPGDTIFAAVVGVEGNIAGTFTTTADAAGVYLNFTPNVAAQPVNISSGSLVGNTLYYSGGNGAQFVLLKSTNVTAPMSAWIRAATNFSTPGAFTLPIGAEGPRMFYRIQSE